MSTAWTRRAPACKQDTWRGVDLSYVNELEDCGAVYRAGESQEDPYEIFAGAGANIVRLRLWHTPTWTRYGTLADVKQSIRRARGARMRVLLDFHYSDDWAHPGKQLVPIAWRDATSVEALAQRLYSYTHGVLSELHAEDLLPDVVQLGNEINTDILIDHEVAEDAPVNWSRNAVLLQALAKRTVCEEQYGSLLCKMMREIEELEFGSSQNAYVVQEQDAGFHE